MRILNSPVPPPMPGIGAARLPMEEIQKAAARGAQAWNKSQLEDVLRSIEFFAAQVRNSLDKPEPPVNPVPMPSSRGY